MITKKLTSIAFLLLVTGVSVTAWALTIRTFRFHGSACVPANASRNNVDYGSFGVHNISGSPVTVFCALPY